MNFIKHGNVMVNLDLVKSIICSEDDTKEIIFTYAFMFRDDHAFDTFEFPDAESRDKYFNELTGRCL